MSKLWCAGSGVLGCPSQHQVLTLSSHQPCHTLGTGRQPACVPRASSNSFPFPEDRRAAWHFCTVWLTGSPLPFPAAGAFQAAGSARCLSGSVLGIGGLCRKEFAGQRAERSRATLFLLAVTLTWTRRPGGFGNSHPRDGSPGCPLSVCAPDEPLLPAPSTPRSRPCCKPGKQSISKLQALVLGCGVPTREAFGMEA